MIGWPKSPAKRRKRLYEAGIALVAVAVAYGLVSGDEADAWVAVLGVALGVARRNVTPDEDDPTA